MSIMTCCRLCLWYIFFITFILPVVMGKGCDADTVLDDTIVNIVHVSAALSHLCYSLFSESERVSRIFVRRRRRCVSDIFSELGQINTRRAYRMDGTTFWKLYNMLEPYYPHKRSNSTRLSISTFMRQSVTKVSEYFK